MRWLLVLPFVGLVAVGCDHAASSRLEPAPGAAGPAVAPAPAPATSGAPSPARAAGAASVGPEAGKGEGGAAAPADAPVAADAGLAALAPVLTGDDGALLPQTHDEPRVSSKWFQAGVHALFDAIRKDDPRIAEPFFFPIQAYRAVKAIADPDRDYERRLLANFRRDVHDYHAKLGAGAAEARFAGIDVPVERMRWMEPHTEGNKLPYFRVTRSRLRYDTPSGKAASLEVTSFISWRGEWYVVHLNGFE